MIFKSSLVGEELILWSDEHALLRERVEVELHAFLTNQGFQRVYTPYIAKYNEFVAQPWGKTQNDDEVYQYLPKKWYMHLLIAIEGPLSYRQLPVNLFEICECYYDGFPMQNRPGVVLTSIVASDQVEMSLISLIKLSKTLVISGIKFVDFKHTSRILDHNLYTKDDNTKVPLAVVSLETTWLPELF